MSQTSTRRLAEFISVRAEQQIPDEPREFVRTALLDTIACALYGREVQWSRIASEWMYSQAPRRASARLWGEPEPTLTPAGAAFVNAIAAHAFELDDFHAAKIHPGAVVVPVALALGEQRDTVRDTDLLSAIALGYEVMTRMSLALNPAETRLRGWHLTGVTGTLAGAATAAYLKGLDAETTAWALGLAGTQSSGLFAFNADGAMSKRFHAGHAARCGLEASELAELGFTGPTTIIEADDGGMLGAFSPNPRPELLTEDLDERWTLLETSFKPHSCCGSLHPHVDAAIELREQLSPADLEQGRFRFGLPKVVEVQCGFDYQLGSALSAQMNARYCIATALSKGQVLPEEFSPGALVDPKVLDLMDRLDQVYDPELDDLYARQFCGWLEQAGDLAEPSTRPSRVFKAFPSGSPENPDRTESLKRKYFRLTEGRLDDKAAAGLWEYVAEDPKPEAGRILEYLSGDA
jgi:2-methylcitrate dehydratase PrpD